MKYIAGLLILFIIAIAFSLTRVSGKINFKDKTIRSRYNMNITSPEFENAKNIPDKFTCNGENISPSLHFENPPMDAKSLALIADDPDAPSGTWTHWIIWNIDPQVKVIPENGLPPQALSGTNDFGKKGYGGPCPPSGTHHYHFKLFALDSKVEIPEGSDRKTAENAIKSHIIDEAELVGLYSKK